MPLPANNTAWPPAGLTPMLSKFAEWSAWYSNDTDGLGAVYQGTGKTRDGVVKNMVKAARRYFWGETNTDLTKGPERKLHVPVASDLCQASADLLFAEPPTINVDYDPQTGQDGKPLPLPANVQKTAERLEKITGPAFHETLVSGAEAAAALGGVYLRVTWDKSLVDHPFLTVVDYDTAIPEFRWGRLAAVTFWRTLETDGQRVIRYLERHETDADKVGVIYYGLFTGTVRELGQPLPLEDHAETRALSAEVDEDGKISTESEGLDVFHWKNTGPNRRWRTDALGRSLGRSDLDGVEGLLDALDEAYTSLMRDLRLGKAMLVVPDFMLQNNGPGRGTSFEQNEVYAPVRAQPKDSAGLEVEQVQFAIRVTEHEQTIALLWNTIIRSAGYSAQTFGEGGDVAMTATEVFAKERRSGLSKGRKGRTVRPVLVEAVRKMLAIDQVVFNSGADPKLSLHVELSDGVMDDPEALARTAQALAAALAASIETRVRLVNPGQDETWIQAEVERIRAENQLELADPDTVGLDGGSLSGDFA